MKSKDEGGRMKDEQLRSCCIDDSVAFRLHPSSFILLLDPFVSDLRFNFHRHRL
jgi:hypothetical protein